MLFGKRKEEKKTTVCECSAESVPVKETDSFFGEPADGICCVKVLGAGCKSCHELFENTKTAVKNKGLHVEVEYVTDMEKVMAYGAMSMPVLVINEKVVSAGRVLKASEVEKYL